MPRAKFKKEKKMTKSKKMYKQMKQVHTEKRDNDCPKLFNIFAEGRGWIFCRGWGTDVRRDEKMNIATVSFVT